MLENGFHGKKTMSCIIMEAIERTIKVNWGDGILLSRGCVGHSK